MQVFETPQPIRAIVAVAGGDVRVTAGERADTTVDVRPADAGNREDVQAAERTRVEYADGQLIVKSSKLRAWTTRGQGGAIEVAVELPAGSDLDAAGALADLTTVGPLGECRVKTGLGQVRIDSAERLQLKSGAGDVDVGRVAGHAEISTGSGDVRVTELAGTGVIKNSNGDTWVGTAHGELRLHGANGALAVARAEAGVVAKAANGDVRADDVARGTVVLETKVGDVEVGIREGTTAWLDASAAAGRVHNALTPADAPGPAAEKVEVRARTTLGNVLVRRS